MLRIFLVYTQIIYFNYFNVKIYDFCLKCVTKKRIKIKTWISTPRPTSLRHLIFQYWGGLFSKSSHNNIFISIYLCKLIRFCQTLESILFPWIWRKEDFDPSVQHVWQKWYCLTFWGYAIKKDSLSLSLSLRVCVSLSPSLNQGT